MPGIEEPPALGPGLFFPCAWTGELHANAIANRPAETSPEKTILLEATRDEEGVGEKFGIIRCGTVEENPDSRIPGRKQRGRKQNGRKETDPEETASVANGLRTH